MQLNWLSAGVSPLVGYANKLAKERPTRCLVSGLVAMSVLSGEVPN